MPPPDSAFGRVRPFRGVHRQSCSHADENKRQRSVRTEKLQNNGGGRIVDCAAHKLRIAEVTGIAVAAVKLVTLAKDIVIVAVGVYHLMASV